MRHRIGTALAALAMVALTAAPAAADAPYPAGVSADDLRAAGVSEGVVAAGGAHSCTVTSLGDVYCWGDDSSGQLGDGTSTHAGGQAVFAFRTAVQVDAGRAHTCAVGADGNAYCWGDDSAGQLGTGTAGDRDEPAEVTGLDGHLIVQVATGARHTCAVDDEGAAWCWGDGSAAPVRVTGIAGPIVDIAAGGNTTCAATAGGAAYCWSSGEAPARIAEARRARQVAVAGKRACFLDTDGRASCGGARLDTGGAELDRISAAGDRVCGVDREGRASCWTTDGERSGVDGRMRDLDVGADRACGVGVEGYVSCWGADGVPVRVGGLPRPPGAATGVQVRALDGGLRISWHPPADLGSGPFEFFWAATADYASGCVLTVATASGCEVLGLRNGRTYDVAVVVRTRDGLTISDYVTAAPSEVAPEPSGSAYPSAPPRELQPGEGGGLPVTGLSPVALLSIGTMLLGGGLVALLVKKP
ncbi:hypothetical protein COUCH_35795 [Couchioplanes caeruleus]|uniref:RCC1 domain-containing protein n=1 Tax=Couchioplanes caeruleus TaxID=56438 RepID=UPI0020BFDC2E|nr:hypothetical protein [Couchioplanes caeruleus]UQU64266.1 hypothetical protein COUCH_35795 [Couchioplanes caeruleus]